MSVPISASVPARLNEIGVSKRIPKLDPVEYPFIVTGNVAPTIVDTLNPNAPPLGREVVVGLLLLDRVATFLEDLELELFLS